MSRTRGSPRSSKDQRSGQRQLSTKPAKKEKPGQRQPPELQRPNFPKRDTPPVPPHRRHHQLLVALALALSFTLALALCLLVWSILPAPARAEFLEMIRLIGAIGALKVPTLG